jgi:hypothetical protein
MSGERENYAKRTKYKFDGTYVLSYYDKFTVYRLQHHSDEVNLIQLHINCKITKRYKMYLSAGEEG